MATPMPHYPGQTAPLGHANVARSSHPHPVHVELDADVHVARWRPLAHWLLAFPHVVVMALLSWLRAGLTVVSFFTILFTGSIPRSIFDLVAMTYRYQWRLSSYVLFLREDYPPFDLAPGVSDETGDPATYRIEYPERLNRALPFVKWLLVLPHVVLLGLLSIVVFVVILAGLVAVLFTGQYPRELRDFVVGYSRWVLRVSAYVGLLTDDYPPFSMSV